MIAIAPDDLTDAELLQLAARQLRLLAELLDWMRCRNDGQTHPDHELYAA